MKRRAQRYSLALAACCALVTRAGNAHELEEIVVTATKRGELLRDVPLSLVVIPGERFTENVIRSLQVLSLEVPNVEISDGLITDNIYIRGVGSGNERSFEQAVGLFVDNIYMPRSRQYRAPFLDVERVEIARGPQSVLFGLNATAGAIAVHTARSRPGDPFVADLIAEYETGYGGAAVTAIVGGSAGANTGLRLAASVRDTGDGYWENLATGRDENTLEDRLLRGSVVLDLTEAVTIDARAEYADFASNGGVDELYTSAGQYSDGSDELDWVRGQDASLLAYFPQPRETGFDGQQLNFAATVDAGLPAGGKVEGIFGYTDYDWSLYADLDSGPFAIVDAGIEEAWQQASAELRYVSADDRSTRFVLGVYLSDSTLDQEQPNLVDGSVLLAPAGFPVAGFDAGRLWANSWSEQDESLVSAYGMLDWAVTESIEIRGGARYIESRKDHLRTTACRIRRSDGTFAAPDPGNPNDALLLQTGFCPTPVDPPGHQRSSQHLLPELTVQWHLDESGMLYAKASTAAKSGGFVAARVVIPGYFEYDDETALGFEIGYKAAFAGDRVQLNVALFQTDYDDLQVNAFDPQTAAAIVGNAAEVRTRGVEIDAKVAISRTVTAGARIGLLDATYSNFDTGPCYPGEPAGSDGVSCDKSGERMPFAPEVSGSGFVEIRTPVGGRLEVQGNLSADFSSGYRTNATLDPLAEQDAFTRFNARLGIGASNGKWSVAAVGRNLGDERVNNYTEAFLGVYRGYLQAPRTIWLQGVFRFGA